MSQTFITAQSQRMLDSSDEEGGMKKRREEEEEEALFLQIDVNHRRESRNSQQQ